MRKTRVAMMRRKREERRREERRREERRREERRSGAAFMGHPYHWKGKDIKV
jgi:hypothetical protein